MKESKKTRALHHADTQIELRATAKLYADETVQRALEAEVYEKSAPRGNSAGRTHKRQDLQRDVTAKRETT